MTRCLAAAARVGAGIATITEEDDRTIGDRGPGEIARRERRMPAGRMTDGSVRGRHPRTKGADRKRRRTDHLRTSRNRHLVRTTIVIAGRVSIRSDRTGRHASRGCRWTFALRRTRKAYRRLPVVCTIHGWLTP